MPIYKSRKLRIDSTTKELDSAQLPQIKTPDTAEQFRIFRQQNPTAQDVSELSINPIENEVEKEWDLSKATDILARRERLRSDVEKVVKEDPALFGGLREAILEGGQKVGVSLLDTLSRELNFFVAREAGLAKGIIKSLRGEGTVLDGLREGVKDNIGFAEVLKDLGIPEGKELFNLFGFKMTERGRVGLILDILLDPLTYLSFGSNVPAKIVAKQVTKGILAKGAGELGAKSIARFAGKTLLTDKELVRGIEAMKATRAGQATMNLLDHFAATQIARGKTLKNLAQETTEAFVPGFGQNKSTFNHLRQVERTILRRKEQLGDVFRTASQQFTKEEKLLYFLAKFRVMKSESAFREGLRSAGLTGDEFTREAAKFGRRLFPHSPKLQEFDNLLFDAKDGLMTNLAKEAGIPEEILFQNYMRSAFDNIGAESIKKAGLRVGFKRLLKTDATKRKAFVEENLIKDPFISMFKIADELMTLSEVNKGIKTVIRGFGKQFATSREALEAGYREFFPEGSLKFFRKQLSEESGVLAVRKAKPAYIPHEVWKAIQDFSDRNNLNTPTLLKAADAFTNQFKGYVTSVWPAFHFRNFLSNRILRYLNEGWHSFKIGDDVDAVKILGNSTRLDSDFIKVGKSNISLRTIKEWAKRDGVSETSQFWTDIGGGAFDALPSRKLSGRLRDWVHPDATKNNFVKMGRNIGSAIEDEAKLAAYVRALKDGFGRNEATQIAFNGLFDYSNLTKFERQWMRRIFPFYTFTRKNLELQMRSLIQNPGRQANMFKLAKDIQQDALNDLTNDELKAFNELKPAWLRNSFAIPTGQDKDGNIMWATGFGWPQEDAMEFFSASGSWFRLNPLIKLPVEQALQMDVGRSLESGGGAVGFKESYSEAKEFQLLFTEIFKDTPTQEQIKQFVNSEKFQEHPLNKLLQFKVVKKPLYKDGQIAGERYTLRANPRVLNAMRNSFIARMLTTMKQFGDPNIEDTQNLARWMTGMAVFKQDLSATAAYEAARSKEAVASVLKQAGTEGGSMYKLPFASKQAPQSLKALIKKYRKEWQK